MKKLITTVASLATLGLSLAACSNSNNGGPPQTQFTLSPTPQSYTQIERLSRPAVKEVFETFQDHQASNSSEPYADTTLASDIVGTEDYLRPPVSGGTDYGKTLASVLYPDEYLVNLNGTQPAATANDPQLFLSAEVDGTSAFGGRAPNDDVIDLELPILFGHILPALGLAKEDNLENDCISSQNVAATKVPTTAVFPYLPTPH